MNIFTRSANNIEYAYYRRLRDKALFMMKKHENDKDSRVWRKWASIGIESMKKCDEIQLH